MSKTVIVVPCYNEAERLQESEFLPLLARAQLELLFVDDGSVDDTAMLLERIAARAGSRVQVLRQPRNAGKGEAVRAGMLMALERGASIVGYMDADASTPAREILRLLEAMDARGADVVMGARVQLLGNEIRRHRGRHYLGRIFATVASLLLQLPVYDTQCGAKLFRDAPALRHALRTPFGSRWVFDVELIGRLLQGADGAPPLPRDRFLEVPLHEWCDVGGSKLRPSAMLRSGAELLTLGVGLGRARLGVRAATAPPRTPESPSNRDDEPRPGPASTSS